MNRRKENGENLDELIRIASQANIEYTEARDNLKEFFYATFDNVTIVSLLEVIQKIGHPGQKKFADQFKRDYENNNLDEVEIKELKKLYSAYQKPLIKKLNGEEWE